jgi:hypothetical protein
MRVDIPVITRCGPVLKMTKDGAYIKNERGVISWSYQGTEVTGKGIFVATTARAGSIYTTRVLQKIGYEVAHERNGADGSVGYHLAVIKPKNCFHQVRHPLKQIASMLDHQSWGFMNQVIETHGRGLLGCMQYWLKWNELLEEFCVWRYRLEKFSEIWREFLKRIDHPYESLPEIPKEHRNTRDESLSFTKREYTELNWDKLFACNRDLARKIYDKSLDYGYSPARDREELVKIAG